MESNDRIRVAIELFIEQGTSLPIDDLIITAIINEIEITGFTRTIHLGNINKRNVLEEVEILKTKFYNLLTLSSELAKFADNKDLEFSINYDSGKSAIIVCSERDGIVKWFIKGI